MAKAFLLLLCYGMLRQAGGSSYQENPEFLRELSDALTKHKVERGNVHDKILTVNEIHERFSRSEVKRTATDQQIIENNLKHGKKLYEGDIVLSNQDLPLVSHLEKEPTNLRRKRNAILQRKRLWVDRVIPFSIRSELAPHRAKITQAMKLIENNTCLKFKEIGRRRRRMLHLSFEKKTGCWSNVGRKYWKKGPQIVSLGKGCYNIGTILHELTHAIGFWHEQSRPDRDRYVKINWRNVKEGQFYNFEKYGHGKLDEMNLEYDFSSIMHYGNKAFSKNKKPTVLSVSDPYMLLGSQNERHSVQDLIEINALYDCESRPGKNKGLSTWSDWSPCLMKDSGKCQMERQRFCFVAGNQKLKKRLCPKAGKYGIESDFMVCDCAPCSTVRTKTGDCCVFPFMYKGRQRGSCIRDGHTRPWCSLTADYDEDFLWGACVENCEDKKRACSAWAYRGECVKNPKWMNKTCCKSCEAISNCRDTKESCKRWVKEGECKKNPTFMMVQCCHSCKVKTVSGKTCTFPFFYKGRPFSSCIRLHRGKAWCSLTRHYDRDQQWGYCAV